MASLFFRVSGWSSGARRRGNDERKLYMCPGGPVCLFNVQSKDYGQLSARSWWPARGSEWEMAKPYRYWGAATVGLPSSSWTSFPKTAASTLTPIQFELEHAEVLIDLPSFISHPAAIKRHLNTSGPPPPPPHSAEGSCARGASSANYANSAASPPNLFEEAVENTALQEYAGPDLLGMFTGPQRAARELLQKPPKTLSAFWRKASGRRRGL